MNGSDWLTLSVRFRKWTTEPSKQKEYDETENKKTVFCALGVGGGGTTDTNYVVNGLFGLTLSENSTSYMT